MRMRQFTARQPPADIQIEPQESKPDPDVSLKHDDLYVRAWEYDCEQPIFDAENKNATPPKSHKIPVQSDSSTEEMRNTPGTTHECSPEIFLQTEEISDVTDTYPDMEPNAEAIWEQPEGSLTNPRSLNTIYVITRNLIAMMTSDINSSAEQVCSTERARRRSRNSRNAPRGTYVAVQDFGIFCSCYSLAANSPAFQSRLLQNTATENKFSKIFSMFGRLCFIILFLFLFISYIYFFFLSRLSDYNTTYIYNKIKIPMHKAVERSKKRGKEEILKLQKTVSKESPFETLERLDDHAHSDATFHEKLGLLKRSQNLGPLLRFDSGAGWRTLDFKSPRQLHWAPGDFSPSLAGGRTVFAWPRRTRSRCSN